MDRRTKLAFVLAGVLLAVALPAAVGLASDLLSNGKSAGANVEFNKSDGPRVVVGESVNFTTETPWATSGQITLQPYANFSSSGPSAVRVDSINGTWTNVSNLEVASNALTIEVNDKQTIVVSGGTDTLSYRDMSVDDGTTDFEYSGADGGTTALTVHGLPASTEIAAVDASGDVLNVTTTDGSGVATFSLPQSSHTVRLQTNDGAPSVDNSSLTPNTTAESVDDPSEITLEADIEDPDFPDDEVNASFYVDGEYVGSETLQDAGTASVTISETTAGDHSWNVQVEDAFGATSTSSNASFRIADELLVLNESSPTELVNNTSVEVRFFFDSDSEDASLVVERDADNGTVNMTGLPADDPFVVVADAPGYEPRRIYVESLTETQRVYLLPESTKSVETSFTLQDYTGAFRDSESVLLVQRALNGSWQTVQGDYFGASGDMSAILKYNTRHRLVLLNTQTGQRRVLGTYTPLSSQEVMLEVTASGEIQIQFGGPSVTVSPSARSLPDLSTVSVTSALSANGQDVLDWNVTVTYEDGSTSQTLASESYTGVGPGEFTSTLDLTNKSGGEVVVDIQWTLEDGDAGRKTVRFGVRETYRNQNSLLSVLGALTGLVPEANQGMFQGLLSVFVTLVTMFAVGSKLRASTELVGMVGVVMLAGWGTIGWLPYNAVFAAAIAWVAITGLRRGI
jgi:hypothetical protein